jgi:Mn2+/Fe2+ NRAMP family transporter
MSRADPAAPTTPSHEDFDRAADRQTILRARGHTSRWFGARVLLLLVGPGVITFLGENDAPSMLSYAATGAQFGIGFFLPFVVLPFVIALLAQEITVRLGTVSQTGHAYLIYRRFGRFWGNFAMLDLLFTNFLTLVTEFVGIAAGAGYFGVPAWLSVTGGVAVVGTAVIVRRYWAWERFFLALALGNLIFVPVAIMTHPDWSFVAHALWSWQPLAGGFNIHMLILLLADIGATITPWMLFFQQGAVSDKALSVRDIRHGRIDTTVGAALATIAALACIIAKAPLFVHHMNASQFGTAQFAQALVPYIGRVGGALFALGVLEAGLVAATVISTSSAYAFGEVTRTGHSLNRGIREAKGFYSVLLGIAAVAGALVLLPGFPLEMVVIMVNVIAVLTMPPAIGFLLILANDREIMGPHKSTWWLNAMGLAVGIFITLAGIVYALSVIVPQWF